MKKRKMYWAITSILLITFATLGKGLPAPTSTADVGTSTTGVKVNKISLNATSSSPTHDQKEKQFFWEVTKTPGEEAAKGVVDGNHPNLTSKVTHEEIDTAISHGLQTKRVKKILPPYHGSLLKPHNETEPIITAGKRGEPGEMRISGEPLRPAVVEELTVTEIRHADGSRDKPQNEEANAKANAPNNKQLPTSDADEGTKYGEHEKHVFFNKFSDNNVPEKDGFVSKNPIQDINMQSTSHVTSGENGGSHTILQSTREADLISRDNIKKKVSSASVGQGLQEAQIQGIRLVPAESRFPTARPRTIWDLIQEQYASDTEPRIHIEDMGLLEALDPTVRPRTMWDIIQEQHASATEPRIHIEDMGLLEALDPTVRPRTMWDIIQEQHESASEPRIHIEDMGVVESLDPTVRPRTTWDIIQQQHASASEPRIHIEDMGLEDSAIPTDRPGASEPKIYIADSGVVEEQVSESKIHIVDNATKEEQEAALSEPTIHTVDSGIKKEQQASLSEPKIPTVDNVVVEKQRESVSEPKIHIVDNGTMEKQQVSEPKIQIVDDDVVEEQQVSISEPKTHIMGNGVAEKQKELVSGSKIHTVDNGVLEEQHASVSEPKISTVDNGVAEDHREPVSEPKIHIVDNSIYQEPRALPYQERRAKRPRVDHLETESGDVEYETENFQHGLSNIEKHELPFSYSLPWLQVGDKEFGLKENGKETDKKLEAKSELQTAQRFAAVTSNEELRIPADMSKLLRLSEVPELGEDVALRVVESGATDTETQGRTKWYLLLLTGNSTIVQRRRSDFTKYLRLNLAARLSVEYDDVKVNKLILAPPRVLVNVSVYAPSDDIAEESQLDLKEKLEEKGEGPLHKLAESNATLLELSGEEYRVVRFLSLQAPQITTQPVPQPAAQAQRDEPRLTSMSSRHEDIEYVIYTFLGSACACAVILTIFLAFNKYLKKWKEWDWRWKNGKQDREQQLPEEAETRCPIPPAVIYSGGFPQIRGSWMGSGETGPAEPPSNSASNASLLQRYPGIELGASQPASPRHNKLRMYNCRPDRVLVRKLPDSCAESRTSAALGQDNVCYHTN